MPIEAVVALLVVAVFDLLAFAAFRLALRESLPRRAWGAIAVLYWLASAAVVASVIARSSLGPRGVDGEPIIPALLIACAAVVYLPKIVLAVVGLVELARLAVLAVARRAFARATFVRPGWLTGTRLLPRAGLALACVVFLTIGRDTTIGRSEVHVYRHEVVSDSLSPGLDGLRIVHLSDIHVSSLGSGGRRLADRIVAAADAERPDLVVFTGDYGEPREFDQGPEILGRLRSRLGKFAVLGNHDFGARERAADNWTSPEHKQAKIAALARAYRTRGFSLLVNEGAVVEAPAGRMVVLGVGVYDPHHGFDDADLAKAERAAGGAGFRLLIAHSPQYWESVVQNQRPIDLTLVGHTHGAQLGVSIGPLVWSPAALQYRRWGGLYRDGTQYLNVNRGVGYVGLPFRLNMPADVSVIVVRRTRNTRGQI